MQTVSPGRTILVMLVLLISAYSLLPLVPDREPESLHTRLVRFFAFWLVDMRASDLAYHVIFFGMLGFTLASMQRRMSLRATLARTVIIVGTFALLIESIQILLPRRHANVIDLAANVTAAVAGGAVSWHTIRLRYRIGEWYDRHAPAVNGTVFFSASAAVVALLLIPSCVLVSLNSWDRSYSLLLADEAGGHRSWLGEIRWVAFYDRALRADEAERCLATLNKPDRVSIRETMGLSCAYDFSLGSEHIVESTGPIASPPLDVEHLERCEWLTGRGGLLVRQPTKIVSLETPKQLTDTFVTAGSFSVEAWVRPENMTQDGPARIITLSKDVSNGNFMIGQECGAIQFRVRNGISGKNGLRPNLQSRPILRSGKLVHIVAVYDRGVSTLYVDGTERGRLDHRTVAAVMKLTGTEFSEFVAWLLCVWPIVASGMALRYAKKSDIASRFDGWSLAIVVGVVVGVVGGGSYVHDCLFGPPLAASLFTFAADATVVSILGVHLFCIKRRDRGRAA